MAITGPSLEPLRRQLEAIASGHMKRVLLRNLSEEARLQVVRGFEGERNPYGVAWAQRKPTKDKRRQGGRLLRDSLRLMNSILPEPTPTGLQVASSLKYAAVHNYGGKRIPQRQFLPDERHGLGPIWGPAFQGIAEKVLKETVRK